MINARRLILAHFAVAFAAFLLALFLGEWQMIVRSPWHQWLNHPELYYRSVTAHGSAMAYVFPTLIAMGFGYAISVVSLNQALIGLRFAWIAFGLVVVGTVVAMVPVALGRATVLYTFYPPLIAHAAFYLGVVLVSGRQLDMGGIAAREFAGVAPPAPRRATATAHVRQSGGCLHVGLDRGGCSRGDLVPNSARRPETEDDD